MTPSDQAAAVGRKVLDGLTKGRQRAIDAAKARLRQHAALILDLAAIDQAKGRPRRGMAGRITRKLGGTLSESQIQKILRRLFGVRDSFRQDEVIHAGGSTDEDQRTPDP